MHRDVQVGLYLSCLHSYSSMWIFSIIFSCWNQSITPLVFYSHSSVKIPPEMWGASRTPHSIISCLGISYPTSLSQKAFSALTNTCSVVPIHVPKSKLLLQKTSWIPNCTVQTIPFITWVWSKATTSSKHWLHQCWWPMEQIRDCHSCKKKCLLAISLLSCFSESYLLPSHLPSLTHHLSHSLLLFHRQRSFWPPNPTALSACVS